MSDEGEAGESREGRKRPRERPALPLANGQERAKGSVERHSIDALKERLAVSPRSSGLQLVEMPAHDSCVAREKICLIVDPPYFATGSGPSFCSSCPRAAIVAWKIDPRASRDGVLMMPPPLQPRNI